MTVLAAKPKIRSKVGRAVRLTRECDYGFVVLVFLARRGRDGVIPCDEIAAHLSMPYEFLAKILQKLTRAGLVASKQGPHGGYVLARDPAEIRFTDVFRAIDDPLLLVECVEPQNCRCPRVPLCSIIETMHVLHQKLAAVFDCVTVADLVPVSCEEPVGKGAP